MHDFHDKENGIIGGTIQAPDNRSQPIEIEPKQTQLPAIKCK